MEIKETSQTISTIDAEDIADYGLTGTNEALALGTGLNVEQYETNRATYNSRGFEIQLTQLDGLGMSNDWGTVVGQTDTYLFEKIELIRGANALLTGVGNASGTINYVRKRPTNENSAAFVASYGSWARKRVAADVNRVLTEDGSWAGRMVVAHEDKKSHIRDLHDRRTTVYGVVDGQVGRDGVLTAGLTVQKAMQDSPMWGSLTLLRSDGSQAEFDESTSTSADWTYWNTKSYEAFVEYAHTITPDWEAKFTYSHRRAEEDVRLLYAYSASGLIEPDNSGLIGWPYGSHVETGNDLLDANLSGRFEAWGQEHRLIAGLSRSRQTAQTDQFAALSNAFLPLPALPYGGGDYPEPQWGAQTPINSGKQTLTRLYLATHLGLTDRLKAVLGANAIELEREGASLYGSDSSGNAPAKLEKVTPYAGLTYAFTPDLLGYVSYSTIFQNQSQTDIDGLYLDPVKGENAEIGAKAEWFDKKLLTTVALFSAEQIGLATQAPGLNDVGNFYYVPRDVKSRGVEVEATGHLTPSTRLTVGATRLRLTGPDGQNIYEWVPRNTLNARVDTRLAALPALKLGAGGKWQSAVSRDAGPRQGAYMVANAFAAYDLSDNATVRLNVNNLFGKKYLTGIAYGALYGAPRNVNLTLEYRL